MGPRGITPKQTPHPPHPPHLYYSSVSSLTLNLIYSLSLLRANTLNRSIQHLSLHHTGEIPRAGHTDALIIYVPTEGNKRTIHSFIMSTRQNSNCAPRVFLLAHLKT
jgi:hypothetical protein